jgi:hypothetical protein
VESIARMRQISPVCPVSLDLVVENKQVKAAGRLAAGGFIGGAMNAMGLPSAGTAYDVTMEDVGMSTPPGSVVSIEEINTPAGVYPSSGRYNPPLTPSGPLLLPANEEEVPITIRRTRRRLDFDGPASSKKVKKSRKVNTYPSHVTVIRDDDPSDTFPLFDLPYDVRALIYERTRRMNKAETQFRSRKPAVKRKPGRVIHGRFPHMDAEGRLVQETAYDDVGPILADRPVYELVGSSYRFSDRRARVSPEQWEVE